MIEFASVTHGDLRVSKHLDDSRYVLMLYALSVSVWILIGLKGEYA